MARACASATRGRRSSAGGSANCWKGRRFSIFGDGLQVRDFNYIDDVIEALLMVAATRWPTGRSTTWAATNPINLINLARLMIEVNGGGAVYLRPFPDDRKRIDIGDFYGDYRKIRSKLGWRPLVGLRDGLTRTMDYFRANLDHYV
jgi:UDP-glucose 4-epimerase